MTRSSSKQNRTQAGRRAQADPRKTGRRSGKRTRKVHILIIIFCIACTLTGIALFALSEIPSQQSSDESGPAGRNSSQPQLQQTKQTEKTEAPAAGNSSLPNSSTPHKPESAESGSSPVPPDASGRYTVYIETGHGREDNGNWDGGCTWSDGSQTYEEATVMIPIAKAMTAYLEKSGVIVHTDARDDNNLNLAETFKFLDQHTEIAAFVNLHCDYSGAESGTMPLYRTEEQLTLAKALNRGVHSVIDIPDRGETYRDDLETLTREEVHCPAVLFETGAIKADNEILTQKYDEYGKGLAKGLCEYLGVPFQE